MNLKDLEHRYGLNKPTISVLVFVYCCYLLALDTLLFLLPCGRPAGSGRKRILVIKLDAIGDFIIWLDFARGLREFYPASTHEVTLLGNRAWSLLSETLPYFDRVIPVDRMRCILNPLYRLNLMLLVRRAGFDIVVDPTFSREFPLGPSFVRICGAAARLAPQGDTSNMRPWQKRITDHWFTSLFPSSSGQLMELVRNAEFLRALGHTGFRAGIPQLEIAGRRPGHNGEPYYILFPGAGWVNRQWPVERFAELSKRLFEATGWKGIVCGGGGEAGLAERLLELSAAPLENLAGKTTLVELAALVAGAQVLIGNETSAVHLAAAVSTPSLCILGGGHYGRFVPYAPEEETDRPAPMAVFFRMPCFGCNWNCIYPIQGTEPVPCIANISVEAAWERLQPVITGILKEHC
jgi:ADP-heptose:LPS heptosyltransferase